MSKDLCRKENVQNSSRLFSWRVLECLSKTHIAIPITIFCVYALAILVWSAVYTNLSGVISVTLFFCGMIFFTWVEYNVHRYIFHLPATTVFRRRLQYTIHGIHHDFPKDKDRLAMPPVVSVSIATLFLFLFRFIMGDFVFAFMPGFLIGYAAYLFVHYIIHAYPPPKNLFRALWRNHVKHHYKEGNLFFGVSSPLWDYVYGTDGKAAGQ